MGNQETTNDVLTFRAQPLITAVVPCLNEAAVIQRTHERLSHVLRALEGCDHEIVYVDDGSTDRTGELLADIVAADEHVRVVCFGRNFGHQAGVLAGLRAAEGDAVVVIDADLQDPPELITEMVARWREGWRIVTARRTTRHGEHVMKRATAFIFCRALQLLADQPIALDSGDFRLLDRVAVDAVVGLPENHLFLRGAISWSGLSETSVPFAREPRAAGSTKYTWRKMIHLARTGILSSSSAPLRLPLALGVLSLAAAVVIRVGWGRDIADGTAWFGLNALIIGIVAEYVRAVHEQVRGRPPYVVDRVIGSALRHQVRQAS